MLESKITQFTLSADGKILWQEKLNNPLPGVEIAALHKGEHPLRPEVEILAVPQTEGQDHAQLKAALTVWMAQHAKHVLEPLVALEAKESEAPPAVPLPAEEPASVNAEGEAASAEPPAAAPKPAYVPSEACGAVMRAVYDALGVIPRQHIDGHIAKLTPEDRAHLRQKKIRLGPILVFIPSLNKPAAVRLRGVLYALFHGLSFPLRLPQDGIVSQKIENTAGLEGFYRAIGYPLYGGRMVRIDMLDRVINSIYDHAKDGVFQARHDMAEWLGTSIEDLYKILEDMGHQRIEEPALAAPEHPVPEVPAPEVPAVEISTPEVSAGEGAVTPEEKVEKPEKQEKPALARFRLRRGKAFHARRPREAGDEKRAKPRREKTFTKPDAPGKGAGDAKRGPFKPKQEDKGAKRQDRGPKRDRSVGGDEKVYRGKDKFKKREETRPEKNVVMLESKKREEDSPFAILQKLIVKKDA